MYGINRKIIYEINITVSVREKSSAEWVGSARVNSRVTYYETTPLQWHSVGLVGFITTLSPQHTDHLHRVLDHQEDQAFADLD